MELPKCPWDGTNKYVRKIGDKHFYCSKCGREFDGIDDGDVTYGRPSKRLEREERANKRRVRR